jgi:hypothetical protein
MRRTSTAALLAAPLLLAIPAISVANPPGQCYRPFAAPCPANGFCMGLFSKIHQHGPLFNYGPYYGYPPFEPYGPWNSYLQYDPWYYGGGYGGGGLGHGGLLGRLHCHGCGRDGCGGCGGGLGSRLHGSGCGETGWHGTWRQGGWFHGHKCWSCCHRNKCATAASVEAGCSSCKPVAFDAERTDPASRFAGTSSVTQCAAFYPELPTIVPITQK